MWRTWMGERSGVSNRSFVSFTTFELMPPHSPLSEEMGSSTLLPASSPSPNPTNGSSSAWLATENGIASSMEVCARRSLEAATIFIALVILEVFVTAFKRIATALRLTTAGARERLGGVRGCWAQSGRGAARVRGRLRTGLAPALWAPILRRWPSAFRVQPLHSFGREVVKVLCNSREALARRCDAEAL